MRSCHKVIAVIEQGQFKWSDTPPWVQNARLIVTSFNDLTFSCDLNKKQKTIWLYVGTRCFPWQHQQIWWQSGKAVWCRVMCWLDTRIIVWSAKELHKLDERIETLLLQKMLTFILVWLVYWKLPLKMRWVGKILISMLNCCINNWLKINICNCLFYQGVVIYRRIYSYTIKTPLVKCQLLK